MRRRGEHPGEETLALLAGGDLPLWQHWRAMWHVRRCPECAEVYGQYKELREETGRLSEEMNEEEWTRLESEMRANIRLGLAAGALVERHGSEEVHAMPGLRWAAMAASLVFVFGAGVWLERLNESKPVTTAALMAPVAEAGDAGVALRRTNASLELMGPRGSAAVKTVNWDGSADARYFDGETGQVTIHQVAWGDGDAQ